MKEKLKRKEKATTAGISCQYNPFVSIKNATTGITLVALVVTIVILLILAGITLTYVFGDNGIIKLAQKAKNETEAGMQKEQEELESLVNMLKDEYGNNTGDGTTNPPVEEQVEKGEIVKEDKKEYTDENGDKAQIPGGFCPVEDSKENPEDKNTIRDGLVISDVAGDDLDNSKHGNQFVWIPVEDYSKFHLIEGFNNGEIQTRLSLATNPYREAGDTTTAGSPGKPNSANSTTGSSESIAMYKSVKENKGFYIARFEAGVPETTKSTTTNDSNKQTQDGSIKPVSQKGVGVWNWIPWGGTDKDTASDGLPGNDNANGAVKVARSMYRNDGVHKVTSTLCYGVQWDAALNFIDSNYISGSSTGYVKDSTRKGLYRANSPKTTGSNTDYQQKHIYDMAGNVWEWTMEAYYTGIRGFRGGSVNNTGSETPASTRGVNGPNSGYPFGFRPALYL